MNNMPEGKNQGLEEPLRLSDGGYLVVGLLYSVVTDPSDLTFSGCGTIKGGRLALVLRLCFEITQRGMLWVGVSLV